MVHRETMQQSETLLLILTGFSSSVWRTLTLTSGSSILAYLLSEANQPTCFRASLRSASHHANIGFICVSSDVISCDVCQEWKISRLTFEYDSEPFGKERDAAIKKLAMEAGVEVIVKISHTLYDLDK